MKVIQSNLHSCHSVIQNFRRAVPRELVIPFADVIFPEEKLSCVVGREVRFSLAVDDKGAAGSCILASSPEPMRTEILFMHAIRSEKEVLLALLAEVLSLLGSRRAPDLEAKYVVPINSPKFRMAMEENKFSRKAEDRYLLEVARLRRIKESPDSRFKVKKAGSALDWRALFISATTSRPFEDTVKQVHSETPVGTLEDDDLVRLIVYDGTLMVGTIGYTICRNIEYVDKMSILPSRGDSLDLAKALLTNVMQSARRNQCDYIVSDVEENSPVKGALDEVGFKQVGKVDYYSRVITSKHGNNIHN
ncbi:MAG: hypothetical protein WED05_05795 [Candidatus Atabeyarchaeum deiterrae]